MEAKLGARTRTYNPRAGRIEEAVTWQTSLVPVSLLPHGTIPDKLSIAPLDHGTLGIHSGDIQSLVGSTLSPQRTFEISLPQDNPWNLLDIVLDCDPIVPLARNLGSYIGVSI
jgi:hypothetical protein